MQRLFRVQSYFIRLEDGNAVLKRNVSLLWKKQYRLYLFWLGKVMLCYVMLCYVMLCYFMFIMLCFVRLG